MATPNRKGGLFINALAFRFEVKPRDIYFATQSIKVTPAYKLTRQTCPVELCETYPELSPCDQIYTTYDVPAQGFHPIKVNLSNPDNYYFAKRFYYLKMIHYFRQCGLMAKPSEITQDCEVWQFNNNGNSNSKYSMFDRYTVKIDYDRFNQHPQLILSYNRPVKVYNTSVQKILDSADPLSDVQPSMSLFNWVVYNNGKEHVIDRYRFLARQEDFDASKAYPKLHPELTSFLGLGMDDESSPRPNNQGRSAAKPVNKYERYHEKINTFYKQFLDNEDFRSILNIDRNGFLSVNPLQVGFTSSDSKQLIFGKNTQDSNPQRGLNSGPYKSAPYTNIKIISIFLKEDKDTARNLLLFFRDDYKKTFDGLRKYIGKPFTFSKAFLEIQDKNKIAEELDDYLLRNAPNFEADCKYLALYLTPIGKHASNRAARDVYYLVKQKLQRYQIESQCIEADKMLEAIKFDDTHINSRGMAYANFAYTLQNMAIAINAKLRGMPWCLAVQKQNELIVGVGAFRNMETKTQYIGSAFSFDNTGAFNSFEFFQKDELKELAGSIENAIINFTKVNDKPERLIIHYYKQMNKKEFNEIEQTLQRLDVDIPVYVVTISKTESEDYFLFQPITDDYKDLMPYSGTYVNLGNHTYLLCNNTRYDDGKFNPRDGYPFPVKIRIECPNNGDQPIATEVINQLIEQVYQFSRIYWKSVRQQNLPVTVKYPEMLAEIVSHFPNGWMPSSQNNLWFL